MIRTIHLATDHAGFDMKTFLKSELLNSGYHIVDHGANAYNQEDDYNEYIYAASKAVSENPQSERAIIFGGSGQGEAMMANRVTHVRAAVYTHYNLDIIKLSREHNDANVLSIAARFLSNQEMLKSVLLWLETEFSQEQRHQRRITKLDTLHTHE